MKICVCVFCKSDQLAAPVVQATSITTMIILIIFIKMITPFSAITIILISWRLRVVQATSKDN